MIFSLIDNISYGTMHTQQLYAASKLDEEHKIVLFQKYYEARDKVYDMWEKKWGKGGSPDRPDIDAEVDHYTGPFYIVFGTEPNGKNTKIYSSFTESHLDSVESKLRKWFKIEMYRGKVSLREPIGRDVSSNSPVRAIPTSFSESPIPTENS